MERGRANEGETFEARGGGGGKKKGKNQRTKKKKEKSGSRKMTVRDGPRKEELPRKRTAEEEKLVPEERSAHWGEKKQIVQGGSPRRNSSKSARGTWEVQGPRVKRGATAFAPPSKREYREGRYEKTETLQKWEKNLRGGRDNWPTHINVGVDGIREKEAMMGAEVSR